VCVVVVVVVCGGCHSYVNALLIKIKTRALVQVCSFALFEGFLRGGGFCVRGGGGGVPQMRPCAATCQYNVRTHAGGGSQMGGGGGAGVGTGCGRCEQAGGLMLSLALLLHGWRMRSHFQHVQHAPALVWSLLSGARAGRCVCVCVGGNHAKLLLSQRAHPCKWGPRRARHDQGRSQIC
jgi:hypothetical protein